MSEDAQPSTVAFVLLVVSFLGLAPLSIWQVLTFPNVTGMALGAPFAVLLAWSGWRVVQDPVPRR